MAGCVLIADDKNKNNSGRTEQAVQHRQRMEREQPPETRRSGATRRQRKASPSGLPETSQSKSTQRPRKAGNQMQSHNVEDADEGNTKPAASDKSRPRARGPPRRKSNKAQLKATGEEQGTLTENVRQVRHQRPSSRHRQDCPRSAYRSASSRCPPPKRKQIFCAS